MKKIRLCLIVITIFSFSLNTTTINQEVIRDLKVKPALARINSIIVIEYSYTDQNGILKKQNFFYGRVGTGIMVNSLGNIILSSHLVESIHNFDNDFENFLNSVKPAIMKQISATENLPQDSIANIDQWMKNKKFTIISKKALKTAVLSNKASFPYKIVKFSPSNIPAEVTILKIESEDLPVMNFSEITTPENMLYFYNIESSNEYTELIKYYTNPTHSFSINKSTISLGNVSETTTNEDYSQSIMNFVKKTDDTGVFTTKEGKLKGILSGLGSKIYLPVSSIAKQLGDLNIQYNQDSNFNKTINSFIAQVQSKEWDQAGQSLKTAAGFFRNFDAFTPLQALVEKGKKEESGNLKETFEKYKIFIVIFGILILALIVYLIFRKSKAKEKSIRRSTTVPDLPEEISIDTDSTIPDLTLDDDTIGRIDIYINDELDNTYKLSEGETRVGRDPSLADIIISELIVSKIHCIIYSKNDGLYIKDQNSTNGVYVDGYRVEDTKISTASKITLGKKGKVKIILK